MPAPGEELDARRHASKVAALEVASAACAADGATVVVGGQTVRLRSGRLAVTARR